jgi:hypothetical protein
MPEVIPGRSGHLLYRGSHQTASPDQIRALIKSPMTTPADNRTADHILCTSRYWLRGLGMPRDFQMRNRP